MLKLKLFLFKLFRIKYCHKCLSTKINSGYWSRCTDILFGGAGGDTGNRCFDCGYIVWNTTLSKFKHDHNPKQWKVYEDTPRFYNGTELK